MSYREPITDAEWAAYWARYDALLEAKRARAADDFYADSSAAPIDDMRSLHAEAARMTGGAR